LTLPEPLIPGKLIRRYKRFLADIELETGEIITAHCANPGSMMGLLQIGSQVLVSKSQNPKRKLPFSWELIKIGRTWVVVNTANTNRVIHETLLKNQIPELSRRPFGEIILALTFCSIKSMRSVLSRLKM